MLLRQTAGTTHWILRFPPRGLRLAVKHLIQHPSNRILTLQERLGNAIAVEAVHASNFVTY